jgi:hypothetical protein
VTILGRDGDRRDHLALGPRKRARREHDPHEQFRQRRPISGWAFISTDISPTKP